MNHPEDRLVQACRDDTSILTSILRWFDDERYVVLERLSKAEGNEVLKFQGEARKLAELRKRLPDLVKLKDRG